MNKRVLFLLLILVVCFGILSAEAQTTYTWTGSAGNNDWQTAGNWSGGTGYPGNTNNADVASFPINANVNLSAALPQGKISDIKITNGKTVNINISTGVDLKVSATIVVGTSSATTILNFNGPGDVIGTADITINAGGTLTNNATCPVKAKSITFAGSTCTLTNNGGYLLTGDITANGNSTIGGTSTSFSAVNINDTGFSLTVNQPLTLSGDINLKVSNNTVAFNDVLTCSGVVNVPASTPNDIGNTLTTNVSGNTIGGIQVHSGSVLTWNGGTSSGTTVNAASEVYSSTGNGNGMLTIGANNTVNFTATFRVDYGGATGFYATLYNYGNLTFTGAALNTQSPGVLTTTIYNYTGGSISLTGTAAKIALAAYVDLSNAGTISTTAASSPTTPITTTNPCQIDNNSGGVMTINGGTITIAQSCKFNNNSGATYTANGSKLAFAVAGIGTNTGTMAFNASSNLSTTSGASTTFTNNAGGHITLDASTMTILAGATFDNYGLLTTQNSSAVNVTPGAATGNLFNESGATVNSTATTYTMNAGSVINNRGGTYNIYSSTFLCSGNASNINNQNGATTANFLIDGTTMQFSGTNNITNTSGTFIINDGSTITSTSGAVGCSIQNSGTFVAGQTNNSYCNITFNGTSENVTNTSGGIFILGSTSIITLGGASETVQNQNTATGTFNLMSDQYGSASFGKLAAVTDKITGSVVLGTGGIYTVQRFMSGLNNSNYRTYRLLSSPINSVGIASASTNYIPFGNINASYTINGTPFYGAFTAGTGSGFSTSNPNPTIYLYKESLNPSSATKNKNFTFGKYVGITGISGTTLSTTVTTNGSTTTGTASLPAGNGYLLFFIGSVNTRSTTTPESTLPDNAHILNAGYVNQQSVPVYLWFTPASTSLSYTAVASYNFQGYNVVGNPYPSTIDLNKLYSDNFNATTNNISSNFYELTDVNPGQQYVLWAGTGGTSSSLASQYVVSGQGFMAIAQGSSQTLTFKEDQKVYNNSLTPTSSPQLDLSASDPNKHFSNTALASGIKNTAVTSSADTLKGLHLMLTDQNDARDECGIYFSKNCKDTYDGYDGYDLDGVNPPVYLSSFTSDNARVALNKLGDYTKNGKRIKLYVKATADGIYHLSLEDIANIDTANFKVYLIDTKLNDSLDMVRYKTYAFNFYAADTASFANRFILALEHIPVAPYRLITFAGQKSTGGIQLNWNTVNEGNYTSFGLEKLGVNGQYSLIDSVQSDGSGIYTFNDQNPVTGNNIYRLAQNNIHGKVSFAGPVNISYNTIAVSGMFTIYPNPAKDLINITVNSGTTGNQATPAYLASIYNLSGIVMDSRQVNTNSWTQDISSYKAGVYILELKSTGGNVIGKAKFVKTN